jgi:hypothetical protein
MWPFGKKVECFQCNTRVKESASKLRRGFRFCSDACVKAFLDANQFRTPAGDANQWRVELGNLLVAAIGDLAQLGARAGEGMSIRGQSGVTFTVNFGGFVGSAVAGAVEQQRDEEVTAALYRCNQHITEALPYLVAIGLQDSFELFDTVDLDAMISRAKRSPGAAREAAEPLQRRMIQTLEQL